jgi:tight adherence protein B
MPQLWILLFLCFLVIFGSAALMWYRLSAARNERKVSRMLEELDPARSVVTTTVLTPPPARPRHPLAALMGEGAEGRNETGGGVSGSRLRLPLFVTVAAAAGLLFGSRFQGTFGPAALLAGGLAFGFVPYAYHAHRRRVRMAQIEEQFPDLVDFLARSMRSGNALSISMELIAGESPEPLRSEFLKISREQSLGASLETALQGFIQRVPLVEAQFFVAAILLQRETGGNLAEVLGKLAFTIRERLRLRGHVRVASGHGRLTAKILTLIPIVLVVALYFISPEYMRGLTGDPLGRWLLAAAVLCQFLGYLCMKKITDIEV